MQFTTQAATQLFPKPGQGIVTRAVTATQKGRVKFQASYWPARLYNGQSMTTINPNQPVLVLGREGITLLIQQEES